MLIKPTCGVSRTCRGSAMPAVSVNMVGPKAQKLSFLQRALVIIQLLSDLHAGA